MTIIGKTRKNLMSILEDSKRHSDPQKIIDYVDWEYYIWGEIVEIFRIESYLIVVYICKSDKVKKYHPFVYLKHQLGNSDWRDTSTSYRNIEGALAGAMAYKHDGINSHAGAYFERMIGLKEEE